VPDCLEKTPHDAVASFAQYHLVPAVRTCATAALHRLQATTTILEFDARRETRLLLGRDFSPGTYRVLPVELEARMGKAVGEVSRRGKEQQAAGVEVEPADVEPAGTPNWRQLVEDAGTALRIIAPHDLALGLVVDEQTGQRAGGRFARELAAVQAHAVTGSDARADRCGGTVDGEPPRADEILHVPAGAESRRGQDLLQALAGDWFRC
jgi:hypothetical protein